MASEDTGSQVKARIDHSDVEQLVKLEPNLNDHELELTLHTLLTQANDNPDVDDPLHHALEKVISEMELPEMMVGPAAGWGPLEPDQDSVLESPTHLTVENILAGDSLHNYDARGKKRTYDDAENEHETERDPLCDVRPREPNPALQNVYETLSPESLSPISDSGYKQKTAHPAGPAAVVSVGARPMPKPASVAQSTYQNGTEKKHKPAEPPSKLTNEFTMLQVADVKKRIINTHKLMLNFNFLKDGYARTCVELKRTLLRLKQSEVHRAQLLQENERLKRLVIEQNDKLEGVQASQPASLT
ncbi:LAQU0S04e08592g1_1 [Lachancea quebecensis]|uniref:LAQU0S04e08592g1_1 n=1 Tax=Lachancea quebecensis TaxID=1654605 RepID=A0A0N7MLF2_9SACH|nr:LAQU0S04e08592g1_1 [Lachancea quebecensis]